MAQHNKINIIVLSMAYINDFSIILIITFNKKFNNSQILKTIFIYMNCKVSFNMAEPLKMVL
jgi:hypothetical protein